MSNSQIRPSGETTSVAHFEICSKKISRFVALVLVYMDTTI